MERGNTGWLIRCAVAGCALALLASCAKKEEPKSTAGPPKAESQVTVAGVEPPNVAPVPPTRTYENPQYATTTVYYATDRNITDLKATAQTLYGPERAEVTYGTCHVAIPREHQMGELESPSVWKMEWKYYPEKHVTLLSTTITSAADFRALLRERIQRSPRNNAFVFVHGYNVSFHDAARRTAQMAYDLGFQGAPIFYSWPSQFNVAKYTIDEQNIEWSQTNIRQFLDDVLATSGAKEIYLIAHSMGSRGLTRAVASLIKSKPEYRERIREIILAAPDIDAAVFKRDIVPEFVAAQLPVTLYASSKDNALIASKEVHGYARAGDSGHGLVVLPGLETIDASDLDTSLLGHSYYGETSVIGDMYRLTQLRKRASERDGLKAITIAAGRYWKLPAKLP
jgi:esterase/lipase superfamily enzyme